MPDAGLVYLGGSLDYLVVRNCRVGRLPGTKSHCNRWRRSDRNLPVNFLAIATGMFWPMHLERC